VFTRLLFSAGISETRTKIPRFLSRKLAPAPLLRGACSIGQFDPAATPLANVRCLRILFSMGQGRKPHLFRCNCILNTWEYEPEAYKKSRRSYWDEFELDGGDAERSERTRLGVRLLRPLGIAKRGSAGF